jgi:hypothetical protein
MSFALMTHSQYHDVVGGKAVEQDIPAVAKFNQPLAVLRLHVFDVATDARLMAQHGHTLSNGLDRTTHS